MADNKFNESLTTMLKGMSSFLTTKTVVGEPQTLGDNKTVIVPLMDVSFGVGAGNLKGQTSDNVAGGLSGKMSPAAVLVISNGTTRIINVRDTDHIGKIIDMIPDFINNRASKNEVEISDDVIKNEAFDETGSEEN